MLYQVRDNSHILTMLYNPNNPKQNTLNKQMPNFDISSKQGNDNVNNNNVNKYNVMKTLKSDQKRRDKNIKLCSGIK